MDDILILIWELLDMNVSAYNLACLCKELWGHELRCINIRPHEWLVIRNGGWEKDDFGAVIRSRLSTIIPDLFYKAMKRIMISLNNDKLSSHKRRRLSEWKIKIERYQVLIQKLEFKKDVIEECAFLMLRTDDHYAILHDNNDVFEKDADIVA